MTTVATTAPPSRPTTTVARADLFPPDRLGRDERHPVAATRTRHDETDPVRQAAGGVGTVEWTHRINDGRLARREAER